MKLLSKQHDYFANIVLRRAFYVFDHFTVLKLHVMCGVATFLFFSCATTFQASPTGTYAGSTPNSRIMAHYLAATVYERRGQFEQATEELKKAISLAPADSALRIALVRSYAQMSELEKALRACQEALRLSPKDPMLWIWMGAICQRLERFDDAVIAYQRLVELQPGDPFWYDRLIQSAEKANDLVTLIDIFQKLVELLPDSAQFRFQLGYYLVRLGDTEKACGFLEDSIRLDPNLVAARNVLGLIYLDLGRDEEALEQFKLYRSLVPEDTEVLLNLAAAYARLNDFETALTVLSEAESNRPTTSAAEKLAQWYVLLRLEKYDVIGKIPSDENIPILSQFFVLFSNPDRINEVLAGLDSIDGDIDSEIRDHLERVVILFGKENSARFLFDQFGRFREAGFKYSKRYVLLTARLLMLLEQYAEAENAMAEALDRFGPDKWLHLHLANIAEKNKDISKTVAHLKACLEIDPDDPEVMNFLGYFYAENNMCLDEAETLLKRALEIQPDNGFYLDSLGWVYYRRGDADKAIEYIRRAIVKMDTDDAVLRDHLGDAYALRQDYEKAVAEWRRALRLDPKLEGVQEKIDRALRKLKK